MILRKPISSSCYPSFATRDKNASIPRCKRGIARTLVEGQTTEGQKKERLSALF